MRESQGCVSNFALIWGARDMCQILRETCVKRLAFIKTVAGTTCARKFVKTIKLESGN